MLDTDAREIMHALRRIEEYQREQIRLLKLLVGGKEAEDVSSIQTSFSQPTKQ